MDDNVDRTGRTNAFAKSVPGNNAGSSIADEKKDT